MTIVCVSSFRSVPTTHRALAIGFQSIVARLLGKRGGGGRGSYVLIYQTNLQTSKHIIRTIRYFCAPFSGYGDLFQFSDFILSTQGTLLGRKYEGRLILILIGRDDGIEFGPSPAVVLYMHHNWELCFNMDETMTTIFVFWRNYVGTYLLVSGVIDKSLLAHQSFLNNRLYIILQVG